MMFRKPLTLKASSAVRNSDKRKLRQRIASTFACSTEDVDLLVPDNIQSTNFRSHNNAPGVLYLDADGTPLWYSLGKSDELIPTVYTLWKRPNLLPFVSTLHRAMMTVIEGDSVLKRISLREHAPGLQKDQLVALRESTIGSSAPPPSPYAIGRVLQSLDGPAAASQKKDTIAILHTWKDCLWEMGPKTALPEGVSVGSTEGQVGTDGAAEASTTLPPVPSDQPEGEGLSALVTGDDPDQPAYTPSEVSQLLHLSLLQSLATLPPSKFPLPAGEFYSNHVQPSRPAFPESVLSPSTDTYADSAALRKQITLKNSMHKSLAEFLATAAKTGLLTLRKQGPKQKSDLTVMSVNANHPDVGNHDRFLTVREYEASRAAEKDEENVIVRFTEVWMPHHHTVSLFEEWGLSEDEKYSYTALEGILNKWLGAHPDAVASSGASPIDLTHPSLAPLVAAISRQNTAPIPQSASMQDVLRLLVQQMEPWYEIRPRNGDCVLQPKHALTPIKVVQLRKPRMKITTITGLESYRTVVNPEELANVLRKVCASSAFVSPPSGPKKPLEVIVRGALQAPSIDLYLVKVGFPRELIRVEGLTKAQKREAHKKGQK
ncbi:uncharacterized protein SCHCODRAFT_02637577 [Schizophyllum commune H4-8]|nr:uncharacterized protein SCHCODRAFT_02637577 [Schizophyllum commune H4-8]KAI5888746.1 hypothetical protein SCHCODRAFT_02637577 [Schizophyllum commune H4-8]